MHWYIDVLTKKYLEFNGRAHRTEYWMFVLISFLISIAISIVGSTIKLPWVSVLYSLAVFIPSIAVGVRRLHDTNRSGWWLLLVLIPLIGFIVLIVFLATDSAAGDNEYGSNPKGNAGGTPSEEPAEETSSSQQPHVSTETPTADEQENKTE